MKQLHPEGAVGASVATRVWRTILTLSPTPSGPLAIRHAPLLAIGDLGASPEPISAILYPAGMRSALQASFEDTYAKFSLPLQDDVVPEGYDEFGRLSEDLVCFKVLEPMRQAQILACLNCLTEQRVAIRLLPHFTESSFLDPAGCHALYQAARAIFRILPEDPQSRAVLYRLSQDAITPWIGASSSLMLASIYIRVDGDLDAASVLLQTAQKYLDELNCDEDIFTASLIESRYSRLQSLLEMKKEHLTLGAEALENADRTAEIVINASSKESPYRRLVALENQKIVAEARLKSASISRDFQSFGKSAAKLVNLDPEDPYSWRYVALYAAHCGLLSAAALAVSGITATGGLGIIETLLALKKAPLSTVSDERLAHALSESLCDLYQQSSYKSG